jgi:hypothetical protein
MRNRNFAALGGAVGLASLVVAPSTARASAATSSLAWVRLDGAESCIAATALARAVEDRLGRRVFVSASRADLTVEGFIGPLAPSGFRASIRVTDHEGTLIGSREVETRSTSCSAIDGKLALIVSLLIDPDAREATPARPAYSEEPAAAPPPPVDVVPPPAPARAAAPQLPWAFDITAGAAFISGFQPGVAVGAAASVVVVPPGFVPFHASALFTWPKASEVAPGAGVETSTSMLELAVCPLTAGRGRVSGAACVGGIVGVTRGRGVGLEGARAAVAAVGGPSASARLAVVVVGPLVAATSLGVQVPLAQAEIAYRTAGGENVAFRTSDVAGRADVTVGVRLPW